MHSRAKGLSSSKWILKGVLEFSTQSSRVLVIITTTAFDLHSFPYWCCETFGVVFGLCRFSLDGGENGGAIKN